MVNILNFGGGAFVGTAYMLGSLLAFDQVLVQPEQGLRYKYSFFDYVDDAKIPFSELESRVDDILKKMPFCVVSGDDDVVSRVFSVAQGISGGSLLAWSVLGGVPLAQLTKNVLEFDARVYFHFDEGDFCRMLCSFVPILGCLGKNSIDAVVDLFGLPFSQKSFTKYLFDVVSNFAFETGRSVKGFLPSGIFSGEGLELFVEQLADQSNLPVYFSELRSVGKHLIVLAERLNYVQHMQEIDVHDTEVFFGLAPYENSVSIARAIRASCSLPGLVRPVEWYDSVIDRRFQLVDGGVSKTIGFRKIHGVYPDAGVWVIFNPIIPNESMTNNFLDMPEQVLRRLIYNRKCAVWDHLEPEIRDKVVLFEGDVSFDKSLFAWPNMKDALWRGYWCGLEFLLKDYDFVNEKLGRASLSLVPMRWLGEYVAKNEERKVKYSR